MVNPCQTIFDYLLLPSSLDTVVNSWKLETGAGHRAGRTVGAGAKHHTSWMIGSGCITGWMLETGAGRTSDWILETGTRGSHGAHWGLQYHSAPRYGASSPGPACRAGWSDSRNLEQSSSWRLEPRRSRDWTGGQEAVAQAKTGLEAVAVISLEHTIIMLLSLAWIRFTKNAKG